MHEGRGNQRRWKIAAGLVAVIAVPVCLMVLISCGKEEAERREPRTWEENQYEDWSRYTYGHIAAYFSPQSPYAADKANLVAAYNQFVTEICSFLELPEPEGRIHLYVYAAWPEAESITGQRTPFMTDSAIHWGGMTSYGYQLAKFILARNDVRSGQFRVGVEGIAHLLDFSGVNYHRETAALAGTDKFVPLAGLGNDAVFDTIQYNVKQAESASLAGFVMYNYGPERLLMLARSQEGWKQTVESLFQMKLDEFEQTWLDFAKAHSTDSTAVVEEKVTP